MLLNIFLIYDKIKKTSDEKDMTRAEFEALVFDLYNIKADYPFEKDMATAVFRHTSNRKWFAVMMTVKKSKLGIKEDGIIDIVNLKCADEILPSFWQEEGIYAAYHINKSHWLTIALDGSAAEDTIKFILGISFDLTDNKQSKNKSKQQ